MTVKAMDNDTGENGKISYHLQVRSQFIFEILVSYPIELLGQQ